MIKYSFNFRLKIVKEYFDGGISMSSLAKKYKVAKTGVSRWIRYYQVYGEDGLKIKEAKKYKLEYKIKVLEYKEENRLSYLQTAIHFNIPHESVIKRWEVARDRSLKKCIGEIEQGKTNMKKQVKNQDKDKTKEELLKEMELLRAENEYLKKLEALIQEKKDIPKRKSHNNNRIKAKI